MRIGLLILVCHDLTDVPLEFGKLCVYLNLDLLSTIAYLILVFSWILSRLYVLPFYVLYSVLYECGHPPLYRVFLFFLFFLQLLHIYWFFLILRIGYRRVTKSEFADIREKDD